MLTVSSIDNLIKYYDLFQKKKEAGEHDLRIATIFTYGTNEDSDEAQDFLPSEEVDFDVLADPKERYQSSHTRDKLEKYIGDYNKMYGKYWGYTTILSVAIGQGEISTTPLQMANIMAIGENIENVFSYF